MRTPLVITLALLPAVVLAGEPSLDRAVTETIELPKADMAVKPRSLATGVAIRMSPGAQWELVDLTTGATTGIAKIDDLRRLVKERAAKLPGKGFASRLDLFFVADARLEWAAMQQALMAAALGRVARTWIVGRRADGSVGALPAFLPMDRGMGPPKRVEAHRVKVRLHPKGVERDGLVKAAALRAWAWRTKQDAENRVVAVSLNASPKGSIGGVAAVLNEARRLGFALTFDGAPSRAADEIEKFGKADPANDRFLLLPAPKSTSKPPKLEPGKALAGDPHEAPHVPLEEVEEVVEEGR